jgi:hypothetical protein
MYKRVIFIYRYPDYVPLYAGAYKINPMWGDAMYEKILYATDFSDMAKKTFQYKGIVGIRHKGCYNPTFRSI